MDRLCYFCLVLCFRARLFIGALWSPAGKGLTSWLSFVMSNCEFVTFPLELLVKVRYLIVSIPVLCPLPYFLLHLPLCTTCELYSVIITISWSHIYLIGNSQITYKSQNVNLNSQKTAQYT